MAIDQRYAAFVITLRDNPERVATAMELKKTVPWLRIVDAIDCRRVEKPQLDGLVRDGILVADAEGKFNDVCTVMYNSKTLESIREPKPLTMGNVCSYMSHLNAILMAAETMRASDACAYSIIFEDDVVALESFSGVVTDVIDVVDKMPEQPDIVHMYVMPSQRRAFRSFETGEAQLVATPPGLWGMQCYMVTKQGVGNVIDAMRTVRGIVDEQITRVGLSSMTLAGVSIIDEIPHIPSHTASAPMTINELIASQA